MMLNSDTDALRTYTQCPDISVRVCVGVGVLPRKRLRSVSLRGSAALPLSPEPQNLSAGSSLLWLLGWLVALGGS